jgi:solute carrier family 44 protein 1 (choline transporter-like protein)
VIFQVIVLLVILVMRKRIKLVIQLFKEAGRAINSMPLLLLEPLLVSEHNVIILDPL